MLLMADLHHLSKSEGRRTSARPFAAPRAHPRQPGRQRAAALPRRPAAAAVRQHLRRPGRAAGRRPRPRRRRGRLGADLGPFQRLGDRDNTMGVGLGLALSAGWPRRWAAPSAGEHPGRRADDGALAAGRTGPRLAIAAGPRGGGGVVNDVLVVDDVPQLLRALRITLTARGYDVHTAATGRRALAAATARPPDLVILDLGLPDIDGAEVIHRLRRRAGCRSSCCPGVRPGRTARRWLLPQPAAPQAGAGPEPAAVPGHRAGHGLSVRTLGTPSRPVEAEMRSGGRARGPAKCRRGRQPVAGSFRGSGGCHA